MKPHDAGYFRPPKLQAGQTSVGLCSHRLSRSAETDGEICFYSGGHTATQCSSSKAGQVHW